MVIALFCLNVLASIGNLVLLIKLVITEVQLLKKSK